MTPSFHSEITVLTGSGSFSQLPKLFQKIFRQPKKWNEKICTMHSLKEIMAFFKRASAIILGAMHVEKQVSDKDK